ncbi:hypothetical protein Y032_0016g2949 [Ancylostoma ceylanicum]|uniref:Uncharacterized protein n=1 Tax=Ancylostoma ceylanicum TaxID=53326 RepID=A0A016V5Q1_9BILA|nr:hypothetical protein Y032_0016g2949 [Ancylostoma ceylanicum]
MCGCQRTHRIRKLPPCFHVYPTLLDYNLFQEMSKEIIAIAKKRMLKYGAEADDIQIDFAVKPLPLF